MLWYVPKYTFLLEFTDYIVQIPRPGDEAHSIHAGMQFVYSVLNCVAAGFLWHCVRWEGSWSDRDWALWKNSSQNCWKFCCTCDSWGRLGMVCDPSHVNCCACACRKALATKGALSIESSRASWYKVRLHSSQRSHALLSSCQTPLQPTLQITFYLLITGGDFTRGDGTGGRSHGLPCVCHE